MGKSAIWDIEDLSFNPATNVIIGKQGPVLLEPKPSALLFYFVKNPGRNISRDELIEHVWSGQLVSDGAINRVVVQLRKALGDGNKIRKYIVTVPTVGYRFIATANIAASPTIEERSNRKMPLFMWAIAAVFVLVATAFLLHGGNNERVRNETIRSISPMVRLAEEQFDPAINSRNGQLVFSQKTAIGSDLYWVREAGSQPALLGKSGGSATSATWSQDGAALAYRYTQGDTCAFYLITIKGGNASETQKLYDCIAGTSSVLAFDIDGTKLFFTEQISSYDPSQVFELDLETGSKRRLLQPVALGRGNHYIDRHPQTGALLTLSDREPGQTTAYTLTPGDGTFESLSAWPFRVDQAIWGHDGTTIVHPDGHPSYQLMETDYSSGKTNVLVSDSRRIKSPKRMGNERDYIFVSYLHDRDIWIDGANDPAINSSVMDYAPSLSRRGDQLAFVSKRNGKSEIFIRTFGVEFLQTISLGRPWLSIVGLDWSFDDRFLLANTSQGLNIIEVEKLETTNVVQTSLPAYAATWMKNGDIGFSQRENGRWQRYIFRFSTNTLERVRDDWAFALSDHNRTLLIDQADRLFYNTDLALEIRCHPLLNGRHLTFSIRSGSVFCISDQGQSDILKFMPPDDIEILPNTVSSLKQYSISGGRRAHTVERSSSSDVMRTN